MTDKINFAKGFGPVGGVNGHRKTATEKLGVSKTPADRVNFSSVLQEVSRSKEAQSASSPERAEKLAALKEQIDNGTYRPDLEKVAASLLGFLKGVN